MRLLKVDKRLEIRSHPRSIRRQKCIRLHRSRHRKQARCSRGGRRELEAKGYYDSDTNVEDAVEADTHESRLNTREVEPCPDPATDPFQRERPTNPGAITTEGNGLPQEWELDRVLDKR